MTISSKLTKLALGTAAAGMMASAAVPAYANDRYDRRDNDGISAGEVIAGVVILGGLAAILSGGNRDRDYRGGTYGYDDNNYNNGYDRSRYGGSRQAVQMCVNATQRYARNYTRNSVRVTDVTDIDRKRDGYRIRGRLQVQNNDRYGRYDSRYDRRDRYDSRNRYDNGSFTCQIRNGRVVDVDVKGIRR